ncbi:glycosyltransferase family 39 protein [Plantibacter sp. VKM Ac-2880]|uniref:ArnT family glycosyltransferase n=1 Tax=Plantibacter sp. VKM Ac-2880 TaxID=2783827 RepID=UPI00188E2B74|nr:glycosyltransferase family 39 protein [Plantibacter sp. VKM Ac-2880]MBF4568269.1 glycosyltransferase family 39 protein [Plantibacter sp. VKM Ac-2880]
MTGILERPAAPGRPQLHLESDRLGWLASGPPPQRGPGIVRRWLSRHGRTLAFLLPVLAIAAVVQAMNLGGSPQRIDDEGTYTAQAWSVLKLGELAHYTYWYDHPPLGWLQIAAYTGLTGAFDRYDIAVIAAREAMLVATLIAVVLVWVLARRLHLSRAMAAVAALVFAISPLAVQFHRTVYLDNVAVPWLLGAFVLATSRKHQLVGFAGSAAAFGIAVLSKETFLLALPFLAWTMWRAARTATRRYTLPVAATIVVVIGFTYVLFAAIKGELFPGPDRVSLLGGVFFQLGSRVASGSLFDPESLSAKTLGMWWQLDAALLIAGAAAAIAGLVISRLRVIAAMTVFLGLFMLRPGGYLPVPYVIMLLPFMTILIMGVTGVAVRRLRRRSAVEAGASRHRRIGGRAAGAVWIAGVLAAAVVAVPNTATQLRGFLLADLDKPVRQAQQWVQTNVPQESRVIVDDAMWVDLVESGFDRDNVIWYYKMDTDSAVQAKSPNGWRDADYIVTTDSMRTFPTTFPEVKGAIDNSELVATFGSGTQAVEVRRIDADGLDAAAERAAGRTAARAALGAQLLQNPALSVSAEAAQTLSDGQLDSRALLALGQVLATTPVRLESTPVLDGETGDVRRTMVLRTGDEAGDSRLADSIRSIQGEYAADQVEQTAAGVRVTYSVVEPDVVR